MKPLPQSLYDRAELLSRVHPQKVVAEIIGKDPRVVRRMARAGWKANGYPKRQRPSDFAIQNQHLTRDELCAHYLAGSETIKRWRMELRG